jgi:hypothetical protein
MLIENCTLSQRCYIKPKEKTQRKNLRCQGLQPTTERWEKEKEKELIY